MAVELSGTAQRISHCQLTPSARIRSSDPARLSGSFMHSVLAPNPRLEFCAGDCVRREISFCAKRLEILMTLRNPWSISTDLNSHTQHLQ